MTKIGIISGSFDPVHNGHIAFALSALQVYGLDKVIFLPEPKPRTKSKITPFKERVAMLKIALKTHKNLGILELEDEQFNLKDTLPKLEKLYKNSQLFLLVGEDVAKNLNGWPDAKKLLKKVEVIVGQRSSKPELANYKTIYTGFFEISSNKIRPQLIKEKKSDELPPEVTNYALKKQLYR